MESFHDYYLSIISGDNERIFQATKTIKDLEMAPGFCENLIQFLVSTDDLNYQKFIASAIKNQVKQYWENEQLYSNKEMFRNNLLQAIICLSPELVPLVAETICIISQSDYPEKWPQLMANLTSALNNAPLQVIHAILYTSTQVLKKYERQSSSDPIFREIDNIVDYWGNTLVLLLSDVLQKQEANPMLEECFNYCFQIIRILCAIDMPKFIYTNLDKFLSFYHSFFNIPGAESIKITLCMIMKQHIVRYLYDIKNWGNSEDDKKTPEEIQNVQQLWLALYSDLLTLMNMSATASAQLVISDFEALTAIARSNDKEFLITQGNLENFCLNTLIPCVSLNDDDIEEFYNNSLDYFLRDIAGLESESKRYSAQSFLKILGRYYKQELANVFNMACQSLLATYNANPDQSWKEMDTAMFIMGIVIAKIVHHNRGVIEIIDSFDLTQFLQSFIIPQLGSKYPLLQVDALKFIVDFRAVIDPGIILNLFPNIVELLFSEQTPVPLYTTYFIERIMNVEKFITNPVLFTNIDINRLVTRIFALFRIDGSLNMISARCIMRIVVYNPEIIKPHIIAIVSTCVNTLIEACNHPEDASFNHCLFEVIVASITKVGVDVPTIEDSVIKLLDKILTNDVTDFIPYVYQIIGCFLLHYPPDAMANQPFYANQFPNFLDSTRWMAMGNIPALAILVRSYCIRLPQLVEQYVPQIFTICQNLLQGTRSHPHAFMIFNSIIRFIQNKQFVFSIMPQIYSLIYSQLPNQNLKKYRQTYALFMCDACFFLEPDNALNFLGENAQIMVSIWAESLPLIRGRANLESAIAGCMKTLLTATILDQTMWEQLFVGTVKMMESPSSEGIKEDIDVIRIEEEDAKQFDTTFNKLLYAEEPTINPHPELKGQDIVEYMARGLAKYSQEHKGYLPDVITRQLEPHLQTVFDSYHKRFQLDFE